MLDHDISAPGGCPACRRVQEIIQQRAGNQHSISLTEDEIKAALEYVLEEINEKTYLSVFSTIDGIEEIRDKILALFDRAISLRLRLDEIREKQ